jgi:DNA polymerase III, subunits gamma and tau
MPKAIPEDVEQIVKNWNSILPKMSGVVRTYLKSAHLSLGGDDRLMIVLDDPVAAGYVEEEDHRNEIRQVISDYIEKEVEIQIQQNQSNRPFEESYVDLSQIINMDITIEDE